MTPVYERLAVLGLGLLGGSVARAARASGAARTVVGATRRESARAAALREGVVDAIGSPAEVARGADLVVLATPVYAMSGALREIASELREGATVTDVGSVKAVLHDTLPGLLPRGVHYIGSHPMAGSHERGFAQSREDLFRGAACVVTQTEPSPERERLCEFWRALGARVILRGPLEHDAEAAWMSHVPHVLAYAFAAALASAPATAREVGGAGFRDFTRIARSEPELWGDILTSNRKALGGPLQAAAEALAGMSRAIEANDADGLERMIGAAREALARFSQDAPHDSKAVDEGHPPRKTN